VCGAWLASRRLGLRGRRRGLGPSENNARLFDPRRILQRKTACPFYAAKPTTAIRSEAEVHRCRSLEAEPKKSNGNFSKPRFDGLDVDVESTSSTRRARPEILVCYLVR